MNPTVTKISTDLYQVTTYVQAVDASGNPVWIVSQQLQTTLEDYQSQLAQAQSALNAAQGIVDGLQAIVTTIQGIG